MGWKKDLREASEGGLTRKEVKTINQQYGNINTSDIVGRAQDRGYTLNWKQPSEVPSLDPGTSSNGNPDWVQLYSNILTGNENVAHIQGGYTVAAANIAAGASTAAAGIRADADKEVAKAYADAQKYAASLGLEGVKYGADKESEWRQAVANIEVKGKLDLQPIINAGLERVAGIEAQASRDVAQTTGKYSLESMKERTSADKGIGKMQLAGSMYGLLSSVFG